MRVVDMALPIDNQERVLEALPEFKSCVYASQIRSEEEILSYEKWIESYSNRTIIKEHADPEEEREKEAELLKAGQSLDEFDRR